MVCTTADAVGDTRPGGQTDLETSDTLDQGVPLLVGDNRRGIQRLDRSHSLPAGEAHDVQQ
jgi:hypothetical protein